MKVKTSYVPADCDYLTVGKEYKVLAPSNDAGGYIEADDGARIYAYFQASAHVGDRAWEIIND